MASKSLLYYLLPKAILDVVNRVSGFCNDDEDLTCLTVKEAEYESVDPEVLKSTSSTGGVYK